MVDALCQSTSSILSSGLTTVIGFLALVFMQFQIGPEATDQYASGFFVNVIMNMIKMAICLTLL
ncbi:MAG: hypothetical protein LUF92_09450 [Clostridiales bacterium]|nr:hypothetical protein [Clostridiales bacterium]